MRFKIYSVVVDYDSVIYLHSIEKRDTIET